MNVAIFQRAAAGVSETFLLQQARRLPALVGGTVFVLSDPGAPAVDGVPLVPAGRCRKVLRALPLAASRKAFGIESFRRSAREATVAAALRRLRPIPDVVLAQYGDVGALIADGCRRVGLPLAVHFHGFDASSHRALRANRDRYPRMFADVAAVIAVSEPMRDRLVDLGAPAARTHVIPYGVDSVQFCRVDPAAAAPVILAVGRFVEKKAPHKLIEAFALARAAVPGAELRMIGDGPLLPRCRELVGELGVADAVTFLGARPPAAVREEMGRARVFAQHSVVAAGGDTEGSPVAVTEAAVSGLPVVSTRHANIPRIVLHGRTGWLVEEGDARGMGGHLAALLADPEAAGEMGAAARRHAVAEFDAGRQVARLAAVLSDAARRPRSA